MLIVVFCRLLTLRTLLSISSLLVDGKALNFLSVNGDFLCSTSIIYLKQLKMCTLEDPSSLQESFRAFFLGKDELMDLLKSDRMDGFISMLSDGADVNYRDECSKYSLFEQFCKTPKKYAFIKQCITYGGKLNEVSSETRELEFLERYFLI